MAKQSFFLVIVVTVRIFKMRSMFYFTARMPVCVLLGRSTLFFLMAYLLLYKFLQMNADLISMCFIKLAIKMFLISLISRTTSYFSSYLSLWMFLCWLEVSSKPMSPTIWLKVKPHCNIVTLLPSVSFLAAGFFFVPQTPAQMPISGI